jgi:hypothetical protein
VSSWAQARAAAALASYVGPFTGDVEADRHLRLEVRIARGTSDTAAGNDIVAARALAGAALPVREAWSRGAVGFRHVAAVLDRTAGLDDELAGQVVDAIADRLLRTPAPRVRALVTRTISRLAPTAAADRARVARRHDVGVSFRSLPDGLGQVTAVLPIEAARAAVEQIDTAADGFLAHQRDCSPCRAAVPTEIGPARAHSFLGLLGLDGHGNPLSAPAASENSPAGITATSTQGRASKRRGELQVVIDLSTLLGLADEPGLLNGHPVPAAIARELSTECGSLRRIVTDPVDGHLLDYGTRTYLPDALRAFVMARDGHCRAPGCGQPAARSQLDHGVAFPIGPSSTANAHMLCKRDHDLKTTGHLIMTSHAADGSAAWRTRDGQRGSTAPRPYLVDPADDPPPF